MSGLIFDVFEPEIVARLHALAERNGIAVEEAHRRLLRLVLLKDASAEQSSFKEHLFDLPDWDDGFNVFFEPPREFSRPVDLD